MKVGGQYVGLGLGDVSFEIQKIKAFMRNKFRSYAGNLADTTVYDEAMTTAVAEMQSRYNGAGKLAAGKYIPGVINAETKYVMGYLARPAAEDTRPVLFTVCGTGVPWWVGPDADTARAVEDKYRWQPIGYPARPFPMGPSIMDGRNELIFQFNRDEPGFQLRKQVEKYGAVLAGYSQGACVVSEVWENDIKPASGALNWAKPHIRKAVTWGNPDRERGKAWPDPGASIAPPNTAGVTGTLMVDTPDWWRNYAHKGDLYTAGNTGNDAASQDKTAIWQIVRGTNVFSGPDSLLAQFLELAIEPIPNAIGAFKAMLDAGIFFASGTGPHVNYNVQPAIDYLRAA